ncbi:hypothetical protein JVT61DRAFT_15326 [Boletus reticuloceps]|uniref:Uncharacterized protein n=1 Tax=Boletus reticuloceps TaxID=495285 RepID=A0A8I2YVA2_9AGAM|nr:hypothetical protein JVT61DRAFT_15326 [Boletus reticuloceps]
MYPTLPDNVSPEEAQRLFGDILADRQVNIPDRLLARDLRLVDFPVLRYEIHWVPEQLRIGGYVTHATDRCLWMVRIPSLSLSQKEKALEWLDAVDKEVEILEREDHSGRPLDQALTLKEDQSMVWSLDARWNRFLAIAGVLPDERNF